MTRPAGLGEAARRPGVHRHAPMPSMAETAVVPARPAATVLLLRDRGDGGLEVHLQKRRAEMEVGARAYVFPGGSVDAADGSPETLALLDGVDLGAAAARMHLDGHPPERALCAALHVCAVRECFEEAGLLLAATAGGAPADLDDEVVAGARERVLGLGDLAGELRALGLRPRVEALTYVAHFITPEGMPRRYDTRFFATAAAPDQEVAVHLLEADAGGWWAPEEMLAMAGSGEAVLMPPTRILLEELRRHGGVAATLAELGSREVASILFRIAQLGLPLPDHLPTVEEAGAWQARAG